jgi:hypothetical protein
MPPNPAYAEGFDQVDWGQAARVLRIEGVRVCMSCKTPKPAAEWCDVCDRPTFTERIYE